MSRIIVSSQNRNGARPQLLYSAGGFASLDDKDTPGNAELTVDGAMYSDRNLPDFPVKKWKVELESFEIPNTWDDFAVLFQFEEQAAPGIRTIPLAGYHTFSSFATMLQTQLNAVGTLTYTVVYTAFPTTGTATSDSFTISATGNFRLSFQQEQPGSLVARMNWTQSSSRMLGLRLQTFAPTFLTPYAASITSQVPAILASHRSLLLTIDKLSTPSVSFGPVSSGGGSNSGSTPASFTVAIDKGKREIVNYAPLKSQRQILELDNSFFNGLWALRVYVRGLDGVTLTRLPDWTMTLGISRD